MKIPKVKAGIIALLLKIGPKLLSVFGKLAKGGKVLKAGLAVASVVTYSYLFTWQFALAIVIGIFIHEMGHVHTMRKYGMKVRGIYLIPLIGGVAVGESAFPSRKAESHIALMGPVWGFALTLLCLWLYAASSNTMFGAIAGWMALVNLFNLLPITPLDGGRVFKSIFLSINKTAGYIFIIICILVSSFVAFYAGFMLFSLLAVVGTLELIGDFYEIKKIKKAEQTIELGKTNLSNLKAAYVKATTMGNVADV